MRIGKDEREAESTNVDLELSWPWERGWRRWEVSSLPLLFQGGLNQFILPSPSSSSTWSIGGITTTLSSSSSLSLPHSLTENDLIHWCWRRVEGGRREMHFVGEWSMMSYWSGLSSYCLVSSFAPYSPLDIRVVTLSIGRLPPLMVAVGRWDDDIQAVTLSGNDCIEIISTRKTMCRSDQSHRRRERSSIFRPQAISLSLSLL